MTMKPTKSILDESFAYIPSTATAVELTWRKYGWVPVTEQERKSRRRARVAGNDARVVDINVLRTA